jgi:hypothetical protein
MVTVIQEAREKNFKIQTGIPVLTQAYKRLIIGQINTIGLAVEKIDKAQLEKYSDIVIESRVFAAYVQGTSVVMKVQSTKAHEKLQSAESRQIQHSGRAWATLSNMHDHCK